jgi:NhaP-type Na+/H+ or K+/H+ antiporter
LVCSLIFKHMRFLVNSEITQVVITYLFGILSYVIAELLDMSGVITVLISGVALAHYNFYNLTPGGMHASSYCGIYAGSSSSSSPSSPKRWSSSIWAFR